MHAITIFKALLTQDAGVTALVGDRIYPLEVPIDCALPAIAIESGLDDPLPTMDANANYGLRQVPAQVHLIAQAASDLLTLIPAVEAACNFKRGTVAGLNVVTVAAGSVGAAETDSGTGLWYVPILFTLTYRR